MNIDTVKLFILGYDYLIREWSIQAKNNVIIIKHGVLDGIMQSKCECVEKGRAGRSIDEQIMSRMASRISKQRDKGYVTTFEEALKKGKPKNILGFMKPMLAKRFDQIKNIDLEHSFLQYKYNGHRCLITKHNGEIIAYSRGGKIIDTIDHILHGISIEEGQTIDGELYCHNTALQTISSWVKRKQENTKNLFFIAYDIVNNSPYELRMDELCSFDFRGNIRIAPTRKTSSIPSIKDELATAIFYGYEGLIIRQGDYGYEDGKRSKSLVKVKRCFDDEFLVIDIHKSIDGWAVLECLLPNEKSFKVSAPGDIPTKQMIWINKDNYINKLIQVEYFEMTIGGIPFHPVATYWRGENEL